MRVFACAAALCVSAAWAGLLPEKIQDAIAAELSGEAAHDTVVILSRFERIQASQGWHQAALYIQSQLERAGFGDPHIEGWPSNGSTEYFTWQTPIGWSAQRAGLEMTEPYVKKLADYREIPNSLVKHSGPANVTAELVDVGSGLEARDYAGKDVKGKMVLAYGYSGDVARQAVQQRGAVGMVSYIPQWDRKQYPDLLQYTALWPKWEERESLGFGFNVSKYDAAELQNLLRSGKKVTLKAHVEAEFYQSKIEILTTTIAGTDSNREVLLAAHLDHPQPSANDNASGSAGLLEIARGLKALIDRGVLPRPRRSIRFLWVSEYYGTVAYLRNHPDFGARTIAAINCDMIGEDQARTGSYFYATRTPHSRPSFLNDVIESFVTTAGTLPLAELRGSSAPFHARIVPYTGGSDHYFFNDASFAVPATMLGHEPDPFHHTAQDTPDKVDPTEMKRVSWIAAAGAWFLATAGDAEVDPLLVEMYRGSLARFSSDVATAKRALLAAAQLAPAYRHTLNVVEQAGAREVASVRSAGVLASSEAAKAVVAEAAGRLARFVALTADEVKLLGSRLARERKQPLESAAAAAGDGIVPVRSPDFKAPLAGDYLARKLGREAVEAAPILSGDQAWEAVNFADGKRSLAEIHRALDAEFPGVPMERLRNYFALLEKAGLFSRARE